jgi:hypothetical protein
MEFNHDILTAEEVAKYLKKSISWVYKNWDVLGGKKLRGSLFFPGKEKLYEHIFSKGKRMEVRFHKGQSTSNVKVLQNKNRSKRSRTSKKGGTKKSCNTDANRHKLLGPN